MLSWRHSAKLARFLQVQAKPCSIMWRCWAKLQTGHSWLSSSAFCRGREGCERRPVLAHAIPLPESTNDILSNSLLFQHRQMIPTRASLQWHTVFLPFDWRRALLPETVSTYDRLLVSVTLEKREGACALFVQKTPDMFTNLPSARKPYLTYCYPANFRKRLIFRIVRKFLEVMKINSLLINFPGLKCAVKRSQLWKLVASEMPKSQIY